MKRTLLEVFGGLAALVLVVSFHQQIARLESQQHDVSMLERKVDRAVEAVAAVGSSRDLDQLRQQLVDTMESRLERLEVQLRTAAAGSAQAVAIAAELERA